MPQEWSRRGVQVNKASVCRRAGAASLIAPHLTATQWPGEGGGGGRWLHVTRSCVDREPTDALNVTNHQEATLLSAPGARKKRQGCCVTAATREVWGKVGGGDGGGRGGKYLNWDKSQLCNYQQTSFWCIFNSFFSLEWGWTNYGPGTIWSPLNLLIQAFGQM